MTRKPILLSKNACALILMFTRYDEIFDAITGAYNKDLDAAVTYEEAAKEFVRQLKGYHSKRFMVALIDELEKELKEMA